jgi:agmatine deiminase
MTEPNASPATGLGRRAPRTAVARPVPSREVPARLGYRMPGEFERHACLWMAWPGATTHSWANPAIVADFRQLARSARRFENVRIVVAPADRDAATSSLGPGFQILEAPLDDIWIRDSGPTFVLREDGGLAATTWSFNGWGDKFDRYESDKALAPLVAEAAGVAQTFVAPIITEGGALHVDGQGTVVVTESAVLNSNRNPGLTRAEVEAGLNGWLGTSKVVWIPGERWDSITDGHIDGLMTFVRPAAALFEVSDDVDHPRYHLLREQARALELATDAKGRRIEVSLLKAPRELPSRSPDFCAIYVNCLILNDAVLIPAFGEPGSDAAALATFEDAFKDRRIVQLRIDAICAGGGGIHCVTLQQPAPDPLSVRRLP